MWLYIFLLIVVIVVIFFLYKPRRENKSFSQIFRSSLYKTRFREDYFKSNNSEYKQRVHDGYRIAAGKKIAIAGLGYNLGRDKIDLLIDRLDYLVEPFSDFSILFYGQDSTDGSYRYLKNKNLDKWILLPKIEISDPENRMYRMTMLRNVYLDYFKKNCSDFDYLFVLDFDLAGPVSLDGIMDSIYYLENDYSDVIFANGIDSQLLNIHVNFIGWTYYDPFATIIIDKDRNEKENSRINLKRGDSLVEVVSGFAGFGIYKKKALDESVYYLYNRDICEHVTLNRQLYDLGYKLHINPSLILLSGIQGGTDLEK